MNKHYSFYDQVTGIISEQTLFCSSPRVAALNIPEGLALIEGVYDHLSQRVDVSTIDAAAIAIEAGSVPAVSAIEMQQPSVIDYVPQSPGDEYEFGIDPQIGLPRWLKKPEVVAIESAKAQAMARIVEIEANAQPRAMREAVIALLGRDNQAASRLVAIDDEILAQRVTLQESVVATVASEVLKP